MHKRIGRDKLSLPRATAIKPLLHPNVGQGFPAHRHRLLSENMEAPQFEDRACSHTRLRMQTNEASLLREIIYVGE